MLWTNDLGWTERWTDRRMDRQTYHYRVFAERGSNEVLQEDPQGVTDVFMNGLTESKFNVFTMKLN